MDSPTPNVFEFGGFRLDRRRRLLTDPAGQPVRATPKAFDTLVYFLEHPGVVIDRSVLLEAVWPKAVVEENNLSQAVAALRRVLGDGFIATVERQGYQFVADVRVVPGDGADAPTRVAPDAAIEARMPALHAGQPGRQRMRIAIGAVLGLIVVLVVVALFRADLLGVSTREAVEATTASASSASTAALGVPKVVVLPCDNLSPDPADAYLAASLHIEILNRLANLSGLLVAARTSVLQYSAARPPIPEIARDFNAAAVMECSVRRAGDSILVTAQLVDPKTDAPLWSKSYPGDLSDLDELFGMQVGIAESIASSLGAELLPAEQIRLEAGPTRSPEAYAFYLKALEVVGTGATPNYLNLAIEADPEFALAYLRRADYRSLDAGWLPTLTGPLPWFDIDRYLALAREDANRALALDPRLGFAHAVLARVSTLDGGLRAAEQSYERALELAPNDAEILRRYAEFHLVTDRRGKALELIERAARVDPNNRDLAVLLAFAGEIDAAGEVMRRTANADPTDPWAPLLLSGLELWRGDIPAARDHLRLAERLLGPEPRGLLMQASFYLVHGYGQAGLPGDAKRLFEQHAAKAPPEFVPRIAWVYAYLGVGDLERAKEWASKVAENGLPPWAGYERVFMLNLGDDPVLERPEFLEIRRRLGYRE
jgi:TolB-like protein/DNA-binding winged helix-turn-helix (wHTH) protein/tetratricopeptide (TPR) repeat protein